MEEVRARKRLIGALLLSIVLMTVAGVLSWSLGGKADTINHQIDHLEINLDLLKTYIQAQKLKKEAHR